MSAAAVLAHQRAWWLTQADVLAGLAELPDASVNCVVTSPPYHGLRDYGTASWTGGDPACGHKVRPPGSGMASVGIDGGTHTQGHQQEGYRDVCRRCGAVRVDQQIGLEPTPDAYVARLVAVFREVKRVLRRDGTLWCNLGDSYATSPKGSIGTGSSGLEGSTTYQHIAVPPGDWRARDFGPLASKQLVGIPWRVAFALQADGWWLRSAITLCKRAPMPESVTDRPTSATEMLFLLTKAPRYFYDQEAVREPWADDRCGAPGGVKPAERNVGGRTDGFTRPAQDWTAPDGRTGRNQRNYWLLSPEPLDLPHFAAFSTEIPRRAILAGCPSRVCPQCGAPWTRQTDVRQRALQRTNNASKLTRNADNGWDHARWPRTTRETTTLGFAPGCTHDLPSVPGVVLDPFAGSGTSLLVALRLGRRALGIELSPRYCAFATARIVGDAPLLNTPEVALDPPAAVQAPLWATPEAAG
jgi:DNA modification methylase